MLKHFSGILDWSIPLFARRYWGGAKNNFQENRSLSPRYANGEKMNCSVAQKPLLYNGLYGSYSI
jgi:hypothetical protein